MVTVRLGTEPHRTRAAASTTRSGATFRIGRIIRRLAIPIIVAWVAVIAVLNVTVPQVEEVGEMSAVPMSPTDGPAVIATKRIGDVFGEFTSDSFVMIVLEGQQPLGPDAREYYRQIVEKLKADTGHVEHVQDFWGDPLTAAGAESADGKAAYVQINVAGAFGSAQANASVRSVSDIVSSIPAPEGVTAYVTGPAALMTDQQIASNRSLKVIEMITFTVIILMLLFFFRSIVTVLVVLTIVGSSLGAARGMVAFLGYHEIIRLSAFASSLLVTLAIAAATDYAIFLIGRYQEARGNGEDPESSFDAMFIGTSHVVLASGLTITGAIFCLQFTRLPHFHSLAFPLAVAMIVVVTVALTLGCAVVTVASRFGLLEPKRQMRVRGWRKIGAAVVRWPGPILVATIGLSLIGLLALPGYHTNYNDRHYLPTDLPANAGYAAADRHFAQGQLIPDVLLVESDKDLRNPADFLVIEKIAKAIYKVDGISRVQAITRPRGSPIEHTSIPFMLSFQSSTQAMNTEYMQDRMKDMTAMADDMQTTIDTMDRMLVLMQEMAGTTQSMVGKMHTMLDDVNELRGHLADFDDFFRPMRNYFYWEPHCYQIPACWAFRSLFDSLDGVDTMTDDLQSVMPDLDRLSSLTTQMPTLLPPMIETMKSMRTMMLTMQATMGGLQDQMAQMLDNSSAMGHSFDAAKNDDSFYLPPEAFQNADFQRGIKQFLSPDGHAVRFIISQEGDPLAPENLARIDRIKTAAKEAVKGTPLEGSRIYLAGTASSFRDSSEGNSYDLMIAGIAAFTLIFVIMLIITRAVVAAAVIVGTVALSLSASFGLSVLVWQHVVGIELNWLVMAMSVIILLAVGADYNLLLVSRFMEEIPAGLKTGIIRAMGGTGSVVTAAGLVFAFTMMSMIASELTVIGQVGTTIGFGLLFNTLVVRSFMTPSIAALMGRWFWWPQNVRTRPPSALG